MPKIVVRHDAADRFLVKVRSHELAVDQPLDAGGTDSAPTPSELFVASIASCAGFFASRFLRRHGIVEGELVVEAAYRYEEKPVPRIAGVELDVVLASPLSSDLEAGLRRSIDRCTVKASIAAVPTISVSLRSGGGRPSEIAGRPR